MRKKQKPVKLEKHKVVSNNEIKEDIVEEEVIVDSDAYEKIVKHYTDKKGKFSYELLNKDLMKFANSSSKVKEMFEENKTAKQIRQYVVEHKFRSISNNQDLNSKEIEKMVLLLDEVSEKGICKDFNDYLRKRQKRKEKIIK